MSDKRPDGVRVVVPMLVCLDAVAEIDFCKTAFGAVELARRSAPDGTVVHATLTIGEALVMVHGEFPALESRAPQSDGSSSVVIYVYVEDADIVIEQAVVAGARVLIPAANQFWGDRVGRIIDPCGHVWNVASRSHEASTLQRVDVKMAEDLLPQDLLQRASRSGNEYAWPVGDIPKVIEAARRANLASIGGQLQFRLPDGGTCECHWVDVDTNRSVPTSLPWPERVSKTAAVALADFLRLSSEFDFIAEGRRAFGECFKQLEEQGHDPAQAMCFVWYVDDGAAKSSIHGDV